jgi:hypothetical protein
MLISPSAVSMAACPPLDFKHIRRRNELYLDRIRLSFVRLNAVAWGEDYVAYAGAVRTSVAKANRMSLVRAGLLLGTSFLINILFLSPDGNPEEILKIF